MNNTFKITNVCLYDGSGTPPFQADISIENGFIAEVAPAGKSAFCTEQIINADDMSLAPGFVDVHSHSDSSVLNIPSGDSKISQGITTEVVGNCGFTDYLDMDEYNRLFDEANPALNIAVLLGFNSIRYAVMGNDNRPATAEEREKMKSILATGLKKGAAGMSSGLWYIPGKYADTEEVCYVASALKGTGKPYATHIRNEDSELLEAMEEAAVIARAGDNNLQYSHFKTCVSTNWHKINDALAMVEKYRAEGMKVTADHYPYLYTGTSLRMAVPSPFDVIADLPQQLKNDAGLCQKLIDAFRQNGGPDVPWDKIILIHTYEPEDAGFCGKNIAEIAELMQKTPEETYVYLLSRGRPDAAYGKMCIQNLRKILARDWVMPGSDSSVHPFVSPVCHPREFGTMSRFFRLACESASIQEVIRRMTSLPAEKFNIAKRGRITPGYAADMVLFQPDEMNADENYSKPDTLARGIHKVFVNGVLAFDEGKCTTGKRGGQFLRIETQSC